MDHLPIDDVLPELLSVLRAGAAAVLEAPTGAGKTTRVPLALLDQPWAGGGRIIMIEPRRLAARAAARRMADTLGEAVGETVGYRVRFDSKVGPKTRIEVVTDGLFTRMIVEDPGLDGSPPSCSTNSTSAASMPTSASLSLSRRRKPCGRIFG